MNTQRSAVALRCLIVAAVTGVDGDSLDQLSSFELPDGAQVFVISVGSTFRLNKTSTVTESSAAVAPGAGPGRFLYESGLDGRNSFQMTGTASLTGASAVTDDVWSALPSGSSFYAQVAQSGYWSVSTSTGLCTYNGPTARVHASGIVTVSSAVAAQALELAVTVDGALIGTSTADYTAGVANVHPTTASLAIQLATQKFFTMVAGSTLSLAVRDTSASNNITVSRANLVILPG